MSNGGEKPVIGIVTDSSCDLPKDLAEDCGIRVVPLSIRFGDESFLDRSEMSATEFWERCKRGGEHPQTAAPSPGAFVSAFSELLEEQAEGILCIRALRRTTWW